jgi:hypothetical protein
MEHPVVATASSPAQAPSHLRPGHLSGHPKPPTCHQSHGGRGDEGSRTEHRTSNLRHGGRSDREQCSLRPEAPEPKEFRSNMHDACFLGVSMRPTTSSSMTARLIPTSSWKTTASHAGRVGRTMTSSSSSSYPSTWLTCPVLGSITCPETRSIIGWISWRSSPATFRAHMCDLAIPGI